MELPLFVVGAFVVTVIALWRSRARTSWKEGPLGPNTADRMPDKMQPPPGSAPPFERGGGGGPGRT